MKLFSFIKGIPLRAVEKEGQNNGFILYLDA
jgi:hypothetical protein